MRAISSRSVRSETRGSGLGARSVIVGVLVGRDGPRGATSEPRTTRSLRVVDGPCFADDRDLDLARIFELVLDAARDVLREPDRFLVGNLLALDHDPDLAPRLQRERFGHALERIGDAFELLE